MKKDMASRGSQDHLCGAGSQANHAGQLTPASPVLEVGRTYEAWHPFLRETWAGVPSFDGEEWSPPPTEETWRPGWRYEPCGPEDCEEVWDGEGVQIRTIVSIHKPGRYPTRVFYVRQWRDPDGKLFGKTALRCVIAPTFRHWLLGQRWPTYSPARRAHAQWVALRPAPVSSEPLTNAAPSGAHAAKVEREDSRDEPSPTGTK